MLYDQDIINNIKDLLAKEKLTLSVAESVTAGHLQAAFSSATLVRLITGMKEDMIIMRDCDPA